MEKVITIKIDDRATLLQHQLDLLPQQWNWDKRWTTLDRNSLFHPFARDLTSKQTTDIRRMHFYQLMNDKKKRKQIFCKFDLWSWISISTNARHHRQRRWAINMAISSMIFCQTLRACWFRYSKFEFHVSHSKLNFAIKRSTFIVDGISYTDNQVRRRLQCPQRLCRK